MILRYFFSPAFSLAGWYILPLKTKTLLKRFKMQNKDILYIYYNSKYKLLLNTKYILKILIYFKAQIARFVLNVNGIDTQLLTKNIKHGKYLKNAL